MKKENILRAKLRHKTQFLKLVRQYQAIEPCCRCHPHGDYDDCGQECNLKCTHAKGTRIILGLMALYMEAWAQMK